MDDIYGDSYLPHMEFSPAESLQQKLPRVVEQERRRTGLPVDELWALVEQIANQSQVTES